MESLVTNEVPALHEHIPTYEELEMEYGTDTDKLCNDHERLIEQILEEEEEVINGHRKHIDEVVDLVKQEMGLLNDVDKPGSDVEDYVNNLRGILQNKMEMIARMQNQLNEFHKHLKTEEAMSKLYQQQQNLNGVMAPNGEDDEDMLIDM